MSNQYKLAVFNAAYEELPPHILASHEEDFSYCLDMVEMERFNREQTLEGLGKVYVLSYHGDSCDEMMLQVVRATSEKKARELANAFDKRDDDKWTNPSRTWVIETEMFGNGIIATSSSGC